MGASGSLALAEKEVAGTKLRVDEVVSDYLEFLESTSALIDENIEDLDHEIAVVITQLKVNDALKALPAADQARLLEGVEKHANLHKHSVRRVFAVLSDGYDTFEDMSYAITQPDEDDDGDDDDEDNDDDEDDDEDDEDDDEDDEEAVEEEDLDEEDDEEDEDYNTAAAEEELAAEMDDEDDEDDEDDVDGDDDEEEDDEDALDYEDYEEIVTDEEVLYSARIACTHYLQEYASEMRSVGLPADLCAARVALLRRMLYRAAESMVTEAVDYFVGTYRNSALEDIDNLLCLGMTSGSLSSDEPEDVRSALKNIITVNAVSRQALEDLPFTQRGAIDRAQDEIAEAVLDVIRKIQLQNIDRPRVLEMLMDLDIDDFGDEEDGEDGEDMDDFEDQEDDDEDDDDEEEEEKKEEKAVVRKGKAAEPKVAAAPSPAPKKAGRPSSAAIAAATAANTETNASGKRKAEQPAPSPAPTAPKRGRK